MQGPLPGLCVNAVVHKCSEKVSEAVEDPALKVDLPHIDPSGTDGWVGVVFVSRIPFTPPSPTTSLLILLTICDRGHGSLAFVDVADASPLAVQRFLPQSHLANRKRHRQHNWS